MALYYCFEQNHIKQTFSKAKRHDLVVIDTDGISKSEIQKAVKRGVWVYG